MTAEGIYPRSVTPGIENHEWGPRLPEPGVYVGVDWIRCTGPEALRPVVDDLLIAEFGEQTKTCRGAQWFKHGTIWEPGVMLSWGHRADICQVDVQGQRLRLLGGSARVALLRRLIDLGLKPTRIDGAMDWMGQEVGVCRDAKASCMRGELCIVRKYRLDDEYTAGGVPTRRQVSLGRRDSPVCARIYDKGLEQGVAPPGWWERLEIEWKANRAMAVCAVLCERGREWMRDLVSLVFGAVDFREVCGRSELARRPRAAWWASLIGGSAPTRPSPTQRDASFERWCLWLRSACGPRLLELARAVDAPPSRVLDWLLAGVEPGSDGGPVVDGFRAAFAASGAGSAGAG